MNRFDINGVNVVAKPFDFNLICDLEDMGVSIQDAEKKPMGMVRAYIALSLGSTIEQAGLQMQEHLVNGGSFDEVMKAMQDEMSKSDFFRTLTKGTTKKATRSQAKENA